ncbi:uncharacterized protein ASPGLDRAFT_37842 [Aspergillus glaucus CBS 516.65]|uniref:Hydrophobin n=1 Tax=Aspergillus glaucus CBS 516.65 TaxID=1160497 RepID=A0A1L9VCA1_ASPGL|nr:hypothetical protein ASPGLDRAFT_37842 [Aspergillus glaucus CBS 516.65]OJJ81519.1 hypothetical protein ASPGLDRAFT_37842 [Aspergillus glaucus CBS 516.65]
MQFTTIATLFTLALSVTAHPGRPPVDVHQQKNECGGGHLACCLEHSDIHADGFLSGLLTEGLLTPIIGSQEQSCAKFSLIENLNILGFTKKGDDSPSCKSITACCPEGKGSCDRV